MQALEFNDNGKFSFFKNGTCGYIHLHDTIRECKLVYWDLYSTSKTATSREIVNTWIIAGFNDTCFFGEGKTVTIGNDDFTIYKSVEGAQHLDFEDRIDFNEEISMAEFREKYREIADFYKDGKRLKARMYCIDENNQIIVKETPFNIEVKKDGNMKVFVKTCGDIAYPTREEVEKIWQPLEVIRF